MVGQIPALGRLERVALRGAWATEAGGFTPWLANEENIKLLGDAIELDLEVEAQEKSVGPFRADILCKNLADGSWVLIENQLEKTDHTHLGQLLTYAAGLQAVTIVWIASKFTDEHRAAIDWLNEVTNEDIVFFALEVELWRIGDSAMAPKFNIVSSPNDWSKTVSGAKKAIDGRGATGIARIYYDFWSYFYGKVREGSSGLRAPKPNADSWKTFSLGRSEFAIVAMISARDEWIGVQVSIYGAQSKDLFRALLERRSEIETELDKNLEWLELPEKKESKIRLRRMEIDPKQEANWNEISEWLIVWIGRFQVTFRPILENLKVEEGVQVKSPESIDSSAGSIQVEDR